jgi:hypothetical protein
MNPSNLMEFEKEVVDARVRVTLAEGLRELIGTKYEI